MKSQCGKSLRCITGNAFRRQHYCDAQITDNRLKAESFWTTRTALAAHQQAQLEQSVQHAQRAQRDAPDIR